MSSVKVPIGAVPYIYPVPIVLVGALVNGKPNFATVGDCAIMGINPALVTVSLSEHHHTTKGILEHRAFSINLPHTGMLAKTDYCGMVSGRDVDKSSLFRTFLGELASTPMIEDCPVNLECKIETDFSIQHRHIFVATVIQTHVTESLIEDRNGRRVVADMQKLDPILYALDNKYYSAGPAVGTGYCEGKALAT